MPDRRCVLCRLPFPAAELNRYGECPECLDAADAGVDVDADVAAAWGILT